jgi:hypothetical protein
MKRSMCLLAVGVLTAFNCLAAEPLRREETLEASATVDAIAADSRLISITTPDGRKATLEAGPEIRNFDQIRVGDKVKVTYKAALAASISKSKETPKETFDAGAVRAPEGAKPAAAVGQTMTTTVVIESVDTSFDAVTFKRPDGFTRTIAVASPEGKKFIRTLKKGDKVDVEYTEALAIQVVPAT